jgi:flagellar hook-length control protein FliK
MSEAGPLQTGAASREDLLHPDLPGLLREALGKSKPESAGKRETASRPTAPAPVAAEHETPTAPARAAARVQEMPLPAEGLRPSTLEATAPPAIMAEEGSEEGLSAALLRDGRTAPTPETASDRSAGAGVALKPREADGAAVKGDVIEQIVQRAAVHLKSDQGEARIDLKPEFLGQVRMQIVTENQQVTVRILTESPMVRDLIEQNLHQLKSDLQQQGLQVERVDVSVADNPRRDAGRQDRAGGRRNGRGPSEVDVPAIGSVEERVQALAGYWGAGGRNTINMFV